MKINIEEMRGLAGVFNIVAGKVLRGSEMGKYNSGARVRIKGEDLLRLSPLSDIWKYENLTGQIVSSSAGLVFS